MKWARIVDDVAVDVVTAAPYSLFPAAVAAEFTPVPEQVQQGMVRLQAIVEEELVPGVTVWMPARSYIEEFETGRWRYVSPAAPPSPDFGAATPLRRWVTRLAFLSRFTDPEAITFDLASLGSTPQAAALRRYMSKINAALYIDLDRQDTRAGVIQLEEEGLLGPGRALEILDLPIQPHEVYPPRE